MVSLSFPACRLAFAMAFVDTLCVLIVDDLGEAGEFSIDLYTMPDLLTTKLWDHLVSCMKGKQGRWMLGSC